MAFNGSGTFARVHDWTTDLSNTVPVTASRMDSEDDGFATGLSSCIVKDGQQTCTARIPFAQGIGLADGSESSPALNWTGDTNSGFWRIGVDNLGLTLNGAKVVDYSTAGVAVTGTFSTTGTGSITGNFAVNTNKFNVTAASGNTTVAGTLGITGATTLSSTAAVTGDFSVNTNKFNVTAASGNTTVAGTLGVTGNATFTADVSAATVSGAQVAAQAGMETGTSTSTVVTPGRQHFHKSAAKAWARVTVAAGSPSITEAYNFGAVTDNGAGDFTLDFSTALSTATYCAVATPIGSAGRFCTIESASTTQVRVKVYTGEEVAADLSFSVLVFGDI